MQIDVAFTAVSSSDRPLWSLASGIAASSGFAIRPNPGANKQIGAAPNRSVVQRELVPSNRFRYELQRHDPSLVGKRFPLQIPVGNDIVALTLRLRQIPPASNRATVFLRSFEANEADFASRSITIQAARQSGSVSQILRRTLGMMDRLEHRDYLVADQPSVLCAQHVRLPDDVQVADWVESNRKELVGALIRSNPASLTDGLVQRLFLGCAGLNSKVNSAFTLISRQGVLHVSNRSEDPQPDFRALVELQAMAAGVKDFLGSFASRRGDAPDVFDFYLRLVQLWITHAGSSMSASFGGQIVWRRLCEVFELYGLLDEILTPSVEERLQGHERFFAPVRTGYWLDPDLPARIDDVIATAGDGVDLTFITDAELRRIVRRDLFEARTCLEARAFKAALVLAGSVAEALLLASILSAGRSSRSEEQLQKLGLQALVAEAANLALLSDEKTLFLIDEWLRHFRNLIHPGRERKDQMAPSEDKAGLAVQAVELLAVQIGDAFRAADIA